MSNGHVTDFCKNSFWNACFVITGVTFQSDVLFCLNSPFSLLCSRFSIEFCKDPFGENLCSRIFRLCLQFDAIKLLVKKLSFEHARTSDTLAERVTEYLPV